MAHRVQNTKRTQDRVGSFVPERGLDTVAVDPYRAIVFPNHLRRLRQERGFPRLMALASKCPGIPYIRLSKIERGEVFAKPDELRRIAQVLEVDPLELLVDVNAPHFDIAAWAGDFIDTRAVDRDEEAYAVLAGAALRARRASDPSLTFAILDRDYSLPPVILSRIENAAKPLNRWNEETLASICRVLGAEDGADLRRTLLARYEAGELDAFVGNVANADHREAKTRTKIAELSAALSAASWPVQPTPVGVVETDQPMATDARVTNVRLVPVFGAALPDGLVARVPTGETVAAPRTAGARAWGMRVCRPTLGSGLPSRAIVVVDPDRFPTPGGLAVIDEGKGYRLLAITTDRQGAMRGYSDNPAREVAIDEVDPIRLAAVLSAVFE